MYPLWSVYDFANNEKALKNKNYDEILDVLVKDDDFEYTKFM